MPHRQIQICDDDPAAALITQRGLQALLGESYGVVIAPTPNAAWLACAHGDVELLIVDPGAGSGSASALVRAMHAFRPTTPVFVLTAYDTPGLRAKMRDLGVRYYVAKPIDFKDLLPLVTAALHIAPIANSFPIRMNAHCSH
ncbi:response regulator [Oscillochloris sp. ZM17-4]|uniref:response regulator n=1 Tax=Oscillochloris sp. ZM17-4 TaxID=2866714 RepID=UPI001C737B9F|nr:response regulator [Oscillochloris sp. ZM17-4]MBX0329774.1 response regulator [Oscillochloris sp. ZM17-4]